MKKDYSFKDSSRLTNGPCEPENRLSYGSNKMSRDSWTDLRVEEIKRKYDTPSHRKNISTLSNNDRSRDSIIETSTPSKSMLRDSIYHHINRNDSSQQRLPADYTPKPRGREQCEDYVPTFNCDSKENNNITQKFSHIKTCLKNEFSKNNQKEFTNYRDYPQAKIDPRVQNIDKINSKIKKILDCLHENENHIKKHRPEFSNSFLKGSVISRGNHSEKQDLEETKIISRQKVAGRDFNMKASLARQYENDLSFSPKNKGKFQCESRPEQKVVIKSSASYFKDTTFDAKYNSPYKQLEQGKSSESWFEPKQNHNRNRARSCLGDFKNQNQDYHLSSGKKLDDEISRTTNRIRAMEEQKKKLNIEFKPYHHQLRVNRSTTNLSTANLGTKSTNAQRISKPPLPRMKTSQFSGQLHYRKNNEQKNKTEMSEDNEIEYRQTRNSLFMESDFKKINLPRDNNSVLFASEKSEKSYGSIQKSARFAEEKDKQSHEIESNDDKQEVQSRKKHDNELKMNAEQGIEKRKRRLLETATVTFARETKRLIENLFDQVKLDEEFRNGKIWLRDMLRQNKWSELEKTLFTLGIKQNKDSLIKIFDVSEEQDNPFFSNRQGQINFEKLVKIWRSSEDHWNKCIAGQFNLNQFVVEKFTWEKVDLQRKGYFTVEDLVRFLNMETGTFYRNRDLVLIFKRFTKGSKLEWVKFLEVLKNTD